MQGKLAMTPSNNVSAMYESLGIWVRLRYADELITVSVQVSAHYE